MNSPTVTPQDITKGYIKLTLFPDPYDASIRSVYIKVNQITTMYSHKGATQITLRNAERVTVQEPIKEVIAKIREVKPRTKKEK